MKQRQISPPIADALIGLYNQGSWTTWADSDATRLGYWGLVENVGGVLWRISERGRQFVEGKLSLSQTCWVCDGKPCSFSGPLVSISDALGHPFSHEEVLAS